MTRKSCAILLVAGVLGVTGFFVGKAVAAAVDPYAPTVATPTTVTTSARPPVRDPMRPPARSPFIP